MTLLDRLRPRWQHSDPEVRAEAVRQLGNDDQVLLGTVARQDEDVRVRRIAVKKLEDSQVLLEVAQGDPDESLRELAGERAGDILAVLAASPREMKVCQDALGRLTDPTHLAAVAITAFHSTIRQAAVSRVSDEKALGEVVKKASDPSIRQEALSRISDRSALRSIALSDSPAELALAALEKIDDPSTLHAIAENRTAQKSVRQRAQARADVLISDDHPLRAKERRERQLQLCLVVEALASDTTPENTAEQVRDAQKEWEDLAARTEPHGEVGQRFQKACELVLDELARQERWKAEKERRDAELRENLSARLRLCQRVESLEGDHARRGLEEARAAWNRIGPLPESSGDQGESLVERFVQACERCEHRYQTWQAHEALRSKLEGLASEAAELAQSGQLPEALPHWAALENRWAQVASSFDASDWKEAEAVLRQRFVKAGERLRERQKEQQERQKESRERQEHERQQNLTQLTELCSRLEEMAKCNALNLRAAERELRALSASGKIGPLPPSEHRKVWQARLAEARQQLVRRVQEQKETEEWRLWANVEVQEKLIHAVEMLLETEDLTRVARELRRIQEEWKQVATVPREKSDALWERFRTTRDELWRRCGVYFADNLKKKEALCEKVESLADSTEWAQTAEAIKRVQAEWQQIGPVPQKQSQALWQRFRKPCDQFFERRNEHFNRLKQEREENARKKAQLCERVEALADSTDWDTVTEEIKQLQAEWKGIGPAPRAESEALWNRFRKGCDHFFDRRKRRGELEIAEKLARAESVCSELESLFSAGENADAPRPDAVRQKVTESWAEWSRIGSVPQEQAETVKERFRKVCERIVSAYPESLRGTELDPQRSLKKREKLCTRLEELVGAYAEPATEASLEDLARKLKQALAANTIGGSANPGKKKDWRAAMQEVERLKANWERLGPVIGEVGHALAERFQTAYARFVELRRAPASHANDAPGGARK
jgi:hypothetical protein